MGGMVCYHLPQFFSAILSTVFSTVFRIRIQRGSGTRSGFPIRIWIQAEQKNVPPKRIKGRNFMFEEFAVGLEASPGA
jgi:hypothetical protein